MEHFWRNIDHIDDDDDDDDGDDDDDDDKMKILWEWSM